MEKNKKLSGKKGQTATEMIVILSIFMIILVIIISINQDTLTAYNEKSKNDRGLGALNEISNAAELVYGQGIGAKTKIVVSLPRGLKNVTINDKKIRINYGSGNFIENVMGFNVTGYFDVSEGRKNIYLASLTDYVNISDVTIVESS